MERGDVRPAQGPDPAEPLLGKPELRHRFRRRRREALAVAAPGLRAVAAEALPAVLPAGLWLGLYWPVGSEPDLDPWAEGGLACRLGGRLALPAVLPPRPGEAHGRLIYLPWERGAALRPDACGIPAPRAAEGRDPDPLPPESMGLLLVPALAVDRHGMRLGSGGGWYDRLRSDPAWRAVPALAVLPEACLLERLPCDPWDVPFSGWLTERGIRWAGSEAIRRPVVDPGPWPGPLG